MSNLVYKKRPGTSGISGQLYETKLLSTIQFRLVQDKDIEEFYIGTNVDGLGVFDDICFRFKAKGFDKPVAVFLQAKHRDDMNKRLVANSIDWPKYCDSYVNIRNKFNVNSSDAFFKGAYEDVECAFVFYTNTKDELVKRKESNCISKINDVISTGDDAFQLAYTDNDVKLLNEMVLRAIIEHLVKLIADTVRVKGNNYKSLMNNELIQTYHVILSHRVFIDSDVQQDDNTDYRMARFNHTFFDTTDDHLKLLGEGLVNEALKDKKLSLIVTPDSSASPSSEPSLVDVNKTSDNDDAFSREGLNAIESSDAESQRRSACVKAYCSVLFKLPAAFGNRDLTLRGESSRKEKRVCYLANKLIYLLKESNVNNNNDHTFNIIRIDDIFPDKGFLRLNGGIAGAVGNLLIFDNKTRLLMLNDGNDLAGHVKTLFDKINSEVKELEKYRFDVRVKNFPKLSFDFNEHDKSMVLNFTNRLLFCTNQASESEVERILVEDIDRLLTNRERNSNFQLDPHDIFERYHKDIQQWWIQSENPQYLTNTCQIYQNSVVHFLIKSLRSVANVAHKNKILKLNIELDTEACKLLKLDASFLKTIIVSDCIAISVEKVTRYIETDDYILIDLNYMLSLPVSYYDLFHKELKNVEGKILILTYRSPQVSTSNKDVKDMLHSLKQKKLIVVTNESSLKIADTDFFIVKDKSSLVDLTKESQETIIKNTDVIFQGEHVNLDLLVDDGARVFVNGEVMDKIMSEEVIEVGEPLTTSRYEEIKDLYISRIVTLKRVFHERQVDDDSDLEEDTEEKYDDDDIKEEEETEDFVQDYGGEEYYDTDSNGDDDKNNTNHMHHVEIKLESFYDIEEHAVLITAEPGMGKSSLLTHLSLTTKARDPGVWIVRIDLLDYSRYFHQWMEDKVIDILEALRFICTALFKLNISATLTLNEKNGEIYLEDCALKAGIIFQINMFLHHCSRRKVIFAFDGFDEICPHHEPKVIQFLNILKQYRPREHLIWVTSRTYSKILQSLELIFSVSHQLQPFNNIEQQHFIERYLKLKLDLNELNQKQIERIDDFMAFMGRTHSLRGGKIMPYKRRSLPLHTVYLGAAQYFKDEIKRVLFLQDKDKYVEAWNLNVEFKSSKNKVNDKREFIAIPLHIYMIANYFQHQIKYVETDTIWDLNLKTNAIYEHFMETKLRKIRFEEKNQIDLYKPDNQLTFEREKNIFMNEHKKLAAYAMFYEDVDQLFSEIEIEEIKRLVSTINSGREKTGVIYDVIDEVPRFVHRTIAEYFAAEYISDRLKTEQSDYELKSLWYFIVSTVFNNNNVLNVLNVLDDKLIMDEELKNKVSDARSRRIIFEFSIKPWTDKNIKPELQIPLLYALRQKLHNFTLLFLSTAEFITSDNVRCLGSVLSGLRLIPIDVLKKNTKLINVVLDTVQKADPSQIHMLLSQLPGWSEICDGNTPKEVIIDRIHRYTDRQILTRLNLVNTGKPQYVVIDHRTANTLSVYQIFCVIAIVLLLLFFNTKHVFHVFQ